MKRQSAPSGDGRRIRRGALWVPLLGVPLGLPRGMSFGVPLAMCALLLMSGCGISGPEACTLELGWRVTPTETRLRVGESTSAVAEGLTCGGTKSVRVDMRWASDDAAIATVGDTSGQITAVAPGATRIIGRDVGPYGIPEVSVSVTVVP